MGDLSVVEIPVDRPRQPRKVVWATKCASRGLLTKESLCERRLARYIYKCM
jgi:hypothetical protein